MGCRVTISAPLKSSLLFLFWHSCWTTDEQGAQSSAVIYSIAETARANNLKPYEYFKYLLEEIPKHGEFEDPSYLDDLLPWSDSLPDCCRKPEPQTGE